ncbi:MAG TPA: hypothetical protein VH518_13035 [Tepidisphaeraceae bacterium]|jgi:hypothetical protein
MSCGKLAAAARELRDRWLEQVNATPLVSQAKYEVSRAMLPHPPPQPLPLAA